MEAQLRQPMQKPNSDHAVVSHMHPFQRQVDLSHDPARRGIAPPLLAIFTPKLSPRAPQVSAKRSGPRDHHISGFLGKVPDDYRGVFLDYSCLFIGNLGDRVT